MSCDSWYWDDPSSFSFSMCHHYRTMNFSERTEDFVVVVVGMQSVVPSWEGSRRRSMNMTMIVLVMVVVVIVLVAVTSFEASSPP
jgi:hypothetical protein